MQPTLGVTLVSTTFFFFALSATFRDCILGHLVLVTILTESHALLYLYAVVFKLWSLGWQHQQHMETCLEIQILRPPLRPTESNTLGVGPSSGGFNKPSW